jgi:uncharacterized phiE125 gp8 family phage protein
MVKSHLRVKTTSEDSLIGSYVTAAVMWAGNYCHREFRYNEYTLLCDSWAIELSNPPIGEILSVSHIPFLSTTYSSFGSTDYRINYAHILPRLAMNIATPKLADREDAVKVIYTAGYTAATLPDDLKIAILSKVSSFYDKRMEEVNRAATSAELAIIPYKIFNI